MPSALATERLIVPISASDKRMVEAKASHGNISTAELVRRAVRRYDPQEEEAELRSLLDVFATLHAETQAHRRKGQGLSFLRHGFVTSQREQEPYAPQPQLARPNKSLKGRNPWPDRPLDFDLSLRRTQNPHGEYRCQTEFLLCC